MIYTDNHDRQIRQYASTIDIFDAPSLNILKLICYCLARYFLLRGRKEHRNMKWSHVVFGVYEFGHELAGKNFVKLVGFQDKSHKLKLSKYLFRLFG